MEAGDWIQLGVVVVVWVAVARRAVTKRGGLPAVRSRLQELPAQRRAVGLVLLLPLLVVDRGRRLVEGRPRPARRRRDEAALREGAAGTGPGASDSVGAPAIGTMRSGAIRVALVIARKDLRQRLTDRSALVIAVVAPLGLAMIFSQMLAGMTDFHVTYAVADLDGGGQATVLRRDVIGGLQVSGVATVLDEPTEAAARASVESGGASAAFIIPAGFTAAIETGRPAGLALVGARDSELGVEIAQSLANHFGNGVVTVQLAVATEASLSGRSLDASSRARVAAIAAAAPAAIALADRDAALRQLSPTTYFAASMAVLFLFLSAQIGMVSLFEERRLGTLARMLAGPIRPWNVLLGKTIGAFALGLASMAVLVVATTSFIRADWGPPLGVAALVVAATVAALGVTTLVASFTRTAEAAGAACTAVAMTLGIVGGAFTMNGQGPPLLSVLSMATPHGWFLRGLADLHGTGASVVDCLPAVAVLLVLGLVAGGLGMARARRLVTAG